MPTFKNPMMQTLHDLEAIHHGLDPIRDWNDRNLPPEQRRSYLREQAKAARQQATKDTYEFTINGTTFSVEEYADGWAWVTKNDECKESYATPVEAQQAAINWVRQRDEDARMEALIAEEERRYGDYDTQVRLVYNAMVRL